MVAFTRVFLPNPPDTKEVIPKDGGTELAAEVNEHVQDGLSRMGRWVDQAFTAERYYKSDQFPASTKRKERNRIRLVANFIRRDVDLIASEVLDGEPVVDPIGRHPKDYELGRQLVQLIEWSRDEEENWHSDLEKAITSCIHIGEGVLFEGWDQEADDGQGRPIAFSIDSRYLLWDDESEDLQRTDAAWIVWLSYELVERIEAQWPELEGEVGGESGGQYLTSVLPDRGGSGRDASLSRGQSTKVQDKPRAWVKRQWSKEQSWETYYRYRDTAEAVKVYDEQGEERELDQALYSLLDEDQRKAVVKTRRRKVELWETVVVNNTVVEHHLSPFDHSNGGHGHYPFCFFSYEVIPDEPRARGEIGFLQATQDIRNEVLTQVLEQMFLNNVGYWHVYRGSMTPDEREKFTNIGYRPHQVIESIQGAPPPTHQGIDGRGLQASTSLLPVFKELADDTSGIHNVDRGEVPSQIQSGRAIRALQAKTSRLNLKIKRHIESGLRRATVLRLHNLVQMLRGPRVLQVTDPKTQEGKPLYLGHSEDEIVSYYHLQQGQGEQGNPVWTNEKGDEAILMVLNDKVAEDVVFERVKLTLDTGQEANKLERTEQAEMFLNIVGAPGIPWAIKQMDLSNGDELVEAVEQQNQAMQLMQMADEFEKKTKISLQQALQMVEASMAPGGGPAGGPGPGAPAGLGGAALAGPMGAAPPGEPPPPPAPPAQGRPVAPPLAPVGA